MPALSWLPQRIGSRLYGLAGLAFVTVAVLAIASSHFVLQASDSARDIRSRVEVELWRVNELELLLERHRRIIESAPVELDRARVISLGVKSQSIIQAMMDHAGPESSAVSASVRAHVPALATQGETVLHLAKNFAQAAAIDQVQLYEGLAHKLSLEISDQKRYGNVFLDVFGFKKYSHITGWTFKALIIVKDDTVAYKLRSGEPNLNRFERKLKPLGPFQELDGMIMKLPGMM